LSTAYTAAATRRLIYLSGTRADFGLMRSTLQRVAAAPGVHLQMVATGTHLSAAHGKTVDEIRRSGLAVCAEVPIDVISRTGESMACGIADGLRALAAVLARERPDAVILLGDRGEMLAGAIAALHLGVCSVHLHGGERSGSVDEPVRHAISKLSSYHFVATAAARERLLRMGEPADRIHVVGAPGIDGLREMGTVPRRTCLQALGLPPNARYVLAVFHPVVQQASQALSQTRALLSALARLGLPVIWLEPNSDAGALEVLRALDEATWPAGSRRLVHLPREQFAAAMRHCELMVGNSSAGIIEAASFGTPVLNIGDRQHLREHGSNVLDVPAEEQAIGAGLAQLLAHGPWPWENAWGDGRAGERIAALLQQLPLDAALLQKTNSY
jgi:GDP/UDP-N,N'-diacetylbacillosamine 2-epimerase (hydrolysing)